MNPTDPGSPWPRAELGDPLDRGGNVVLRTACQQGRRWQAAGHNVRVGINLSPAQFHPELPEVIESVLEETGFAPDLLEIEITENILLNEDDPTAIELLQRIRSLGVRIAFDDFGTGYASLSYLKRFPLDRLKIDRSFVNDLGKDRRNTAIVSAIVELGKRLGLSVIAEGIDSQRCAKLLEEDGCEEGQGYYFGKPMAAKQIKELLDANSDHIRHCPASAA